MGVPSRPMTVAMALLLFHGLVFRLFDDFLHRLGRLPMTVTVTVAVAVAVPRLSGLFDRRVVRSGFRLYGFGIRRLL